MREASIRFASVCALAAFVAGCGASTPARQSTGRVEPASSGAGYDFRKEGRIPPPSGGSAQPETDVEEIPVADGDGLVAGVMRPQPSGDPNHCRRHVRDLAGAAAPRRRYRPFP